MCSGVGFMPYAALVDYELTLSLPPRVTADSGIDALSHAIEAYVSQKANPFSDAQALAAMRAIGPNLRTAFVDGSDRQAREAMMFGATLAGMAFSNASVALVHGMSRPIGAAFHVPHGMSNAMLLPAVTAYGLAAATVEVRGVRPRHGCRRRSIATTRPPPVAGRGAALHHRGPAHAHARRVRHRRGCVPRGHAQHGPTGTRIRIAAEQPARPDEDEIVAIYEQLLP